MHQVADGGDDLRQTGSGDKSQARRVASSAQPSAARELLTSKEAALEVFGVGERHFHSMRSLPWMPQPVVLGPRTVRWVRSELIEAARNLPRAKAPAQESQLRGARWRGQQVAA